jgi:hypothetical protein
LRNFDPMDRSPRPYLLLLLFVTICFSCKKSQPSQPSSPSFSPGADIYMAGTADGNAVYWKNGQVVQLSTHGTATGIAVTANGDVYVSGTVDSSSGAQLAVYWKNGVQVTLTDTGTTTTDGIAVTDTNIYVSGTLLRNSFGNLTPDGAVYWKNGAQVNLTNHGPLDGSNAAGLAVSGSDVYVAGFIVMATPGNYDTAAIWENGVFVQNLYTVEGNVFYSIVFNGSDMYVAGESGGYLKNGTVVLLPQAFMVTGLAFSGQNIYAIGSASTSPPSGGFVPAYWKNGQLVMRFDKAVVTIVNAIAATGNDVYIVGSIFPSVGSVLTQGNAVYWKNGVQDTLATTGSVTAITIVPQ